MGNRDRGGGHCSQSARLEAAHKQRSQGGGQKCPNFTFGGDGEGLRVEEGRERPLNYSCVLCSRPAQHAAAWGRAAQRHVKLHPDIHVYYGGGGVWRNGLAVGQSSRQRDFMVNRDHADCGPTKMRKQ